jgi:SAM-dependent methyltransferase
MEPTEENIRVWNEIHERRERELVESVLPERVRERLPRVDGRYVCQLGCGTGEATLELARLGALATGVDPSASALAQARARGPAIAWVHAPLDELPLELKRGRFDLVYIGKGALVTVSDLDELAHGVVGALRPGGGLVLFDVHPARRCLDPILHWREDYFGGAEDGSGFWRLGEIVMALTSAGLRLRAFDEFPGERVFTRFEQRVPAELLVLAERKLH